MIADPVERLNRDAREWRRHLIQVGFGVAENCRYVLDPRHDFAAVRLVVGRGNGEGFGKGGQRLLDVKRGIAAPARISIQLPMHTRERTTDQPVVDLLPDRPSTWVDLFPTLLKV